MNLKPVSKTFAATIAIAASLLLAAPDALLAKKPGDGADCVVGVDYSSIQSAVADAECPTISVPAGTFYENVIINRSVTIRGAGRHRTTVSGSSNPAPVFSVAPPPQSYPGSCAEPVVAVTVEGMTITGGTGPFCPAEAPFCKNRNGGGISASPGTALTVKNCIVAGNSTYESGGGISVVLGRLKVMDSVISRNTAFANLRPNAQQVGGGGLRIAGCPNILVVTNTVIEDNLSYGRGGGILSFTTPVAGQPWGTLVVERSEIKHNTATAANGGGGIYYDHVDSTLIDGKVKNNYPNDLEQVPNP